MNKDQNHKKKIRKNRIGQSAAFICKTLKICMNRTPIYLKVAIPSFTLAIICKTFLPPFFDLSFLNSSWIFYLLLPTVAFATLCFIYKTLKKEISKSNLHEQFSYLDFLVGSLLCLSLIFATNFSIEKNFSDQLSLISSDLLLSIIFLLIPFTIFQKFYTEPLDVETLKRRFAPEASNNDNLNFKKSAHEAATAIKNSEKYVSVVALNGGYGEGKSSYARMIIEEVGAKESLYSYISLTETNATNDFSKLFAERWFEALNERYPSINIAPHVASLEAILRESTNHSALVSVISQILVKLNFGLSKTVAKCWDVNATNKEQEKEFFVPNNTAAMFNHIPKIKEEFWIINIDEIERAQLDEIYRVIEVIERFKHEGRFGLPVKLVFLLCVSGSNLQERLIEMKNSNEKAQLIEDFFFNNPKSRDQNLFLPPVSYQKKREFVINSLNRVFALPKFKLPKINAVEIKPNKNTTPGHQFLDETDALSWLIETLTQKAPRVILRLCQELEFFYHQFTDLDGNYAANKIERCDAIAISLIKMEYPALIDDIKNNLQKMNAEEFRINKKILDPLETGIADILVQKLTQIAYNRSEPRPQNPKRTSNKELMRMVLEVKFDQKNSQPN